MSMLALDDKQIIDTIARWFANEIIGPLAALEDAGDELYTEADAAVFEALFAPLASNLAAAAVMATHDFQAHDPNLQLKIARAVMLYSFLYGQGKIAPQPFPFDPEELYKLEAIRDMTPAVGGPIQ